MSEIELVVSQRAYRVSQFIHQRDDRQASFFRVIHVRVTRESIARVHQNHVRMFRFHSIHECCQFRELLNLSVNVVRGYDHDLFFVRFSVTTGKKKEKE